MAENKIKMEVYASLPELLEFVKSTAICAEFGSHSSWLHGRLNKVKNGAYSTRRFASGDMVKLNGAIASLAHKLAEVDITYNEDRQLVIDQIKERLSAVFLKQIAVRKMGWTESKFKSCMVNSNSKGRYMTFTKADIQQLVLAVREVAVRMLSVEYYIEE